MKRLAGAALIFLFSGLGALQAQMPSAYSTESFTQGTDSLPYRLLLPKDFDESRQYPLILFLHGAGERGSDNEKQLTHGSRLFTQPLNREAFPAIVLFPQCPVGDYWAQVEVDRTSYPVGLKFDYEKGPTRPMELVMALLEDYLQAPYTDSNRVYVMGLSMGGMGTFEIVYRMPGTFAAAVPICGGGDPESVGVYAANTPVRVYHGAVDQVVAARQSMEMVQALMDAGAHPGFTIYDRVNHNSWDYALSEPDLIPWLFSHRKAD